ncbi:hypothetical protein [Reyranella soli]|uniref:Uncharacterized protein n=1 Tax=Reyranella soli TaxID=1230389 RepID=A0A512NS60_9HYPH|nr:hypothetical protein [Reyranella soli]GEP61773.1 hypothetical protein RSO01_89390 [Reyranella soli]
METISQWIAALQKQDYFIVGAAVLAVLAALAGLVRNVATLREFSVAIWHRFWPPSPLPPKEAAEAVLSLRKMGGYKEAMLESLQNYMRSKDEAGRAGAWKASQKAMRSTANALLKAKSALIDYKAALGQDAAPSSKQLLSLMEKRHALLLQSLEPPLPPPSDADVSTLFSDHMALVGTISSALDKFATEVGQRTPDAGGLQKPKVGP